MFQTVDSCVFLGTIVHCSIAASCSLLAIAVHIECREKRRLGSFVAKCFLHKVESLVFHSNVEARPMKGYLAEKQKSSSLSKQDMLLLLIHFLPEAANEKWDLNQLAHVHSVSMVIVSLIPRAKPS